jgi:hypothetical protein
LGVVRHSRFELGWRQVGVAALAGLLFAARHKVPVAVPGLADIAVAGPGGDLFPVEAGSDEAGDRTVACLMGRDRFEAGRFPCLVDADADPGGEERLRLRATEHEVVRRARVSPGRYARAAGRFDVRPEGACEGCRP